jgi:hypothetical protein
MEDPASSLARTVQAMRPMVPAKDFDTSQLFYVELVFVARALIDRLVEMRLGVFSFILQNYYVREWADNFVVHLTVSDVGLWWDRIVSLDLSTRYGVETRAPGDEGWATVAGLTDPSGVLWRIAELTPSSG